ncbi:hypothetical protein ACFQ5D_11190 [Paenibacillus farraposensis]|uniref:Uncharacterized protein n=1 Tax=Paenibacillus farraposensis TaxID=2807095 RepID=A0ABW4DBC1_9BACL
MTILKALEQQQHDWDVRPVLLPCYTWLPHVRLVIDMPIWTSWLLRMSITGRVALFA